MEDYVLFLWLALGMFIVAFLAQLIFPVEVYEKARGSGLSVANKGRFAYTVESLYQIKTKGLDADGKYWWHITWFNTVVSVAASAVVVFAAVAIIVAVGVILAIIFLTVLWGMLSN